MAELLSQNTDQVHIKAKFFRGFADPSRLTILELLRGGRKSVGEIVEATDLSQPNVSNHLRCLSDCGLVQGEREGRFIYYKLSDSRVNAILKHSEQLLAEVARGVYECTRYESANAAMTENKI